MSILYLACADAGPPTVCTGLAFALVTIACYAANTPETVDHLLVQCVFLRRSLV
jgi:hypothetical protein